MKLFNLVARLLLRGLLNCIDECVEQADPGMKCCAGAVCTILCWIRGSASGGEEK